MTDLGDELVKALELDGKRVRSISIRVGYNEPSSATVEFLVVDEQAARVATVLEEFQLVPRERART